jgi:hypothetical protein
LHSVVTCLVVVSTGNHWWLDGIVAVAILVVSAWLVAGVRSGVSRLWARRGRAATADEAPADQLVSSSDPI